MYRTKFQDVLDAVKKSKQKSVLFIRHPVYSFSFFRSWPTRIMIILTWLYYICIKPPHFIIDDNKAIVAEKTNVAE